MLFRSTDCTYYSRKNALPLGIPAMSEANPSVLVIDDDPEFRDSVARLLRTVRLETRQFSSVSDFSQG